MVFTYTGIARVLWGSLPSERILHEDKRAINSSQHTLSGESRWLEFSSSIASLSQVNQTNPTSADLFIVTVVWCTRPNRRTWSFKRTDRKQRKCSSMSSSSSSSAIFQCTSSISSGSQPCTQKCSSCSDDRSFRYVYVYSEYTQRERMEEARNASDTIDCFQPRVVQLERTGTIKYVTISALISHFLPYFNSSINPIIYNVMSGTYSSRSISLLGTRVQ